MRSGWRTASRPFQKARAFSSVTSTWSTSSFAFMRFRNFARFDLFSSFHIRVNCWSLSSAMVATASKLEENAGQGPTGRLGASRELEDGRREEPRAHKAFLPTCGDRPVSIREGDDQIVRDRFDPVDGEGKLRGQFLRLPGLEIPRTVAVLAGDQELLAVHQAVGEHRPFVRARGIDAKEAVTQSNAEDVVPHDLEVLRPAVRDVVDLTQIDVRVHWAGRTSPGP